MAKKRKTAGSQTKKKFDSVKCDNSDDDGGDKLYDTMDYLDLTEEQNLMSTLGKQSNRRQKNNSEIEELYAISGSSDDELPTVKQKKKKKHSKNDQDSDLEMESHVDDMNDGIGRWGGKKQHFYGGNPNDKQLKKKGKEADIDDDELSEAEMEEKEAIEIRNRQLAELDEDDFLDAFASTHEKDEPKKEDLNHDSVQSQIDLNSKVQLDLSKFSQKERIDLFHRESPEFSGILKEFQSKITEAGSRLYPIVNLINIGKLPSQGPAAEYIRARHQIILNYCTNIAAYLMFKTRRTNMKFHPITGQLVQYKQLLDQMESLDEILAPQIDTILKAIKVKTDKKNDHPNFKRLDKLIKRAKQSSIETNREVLDTKENNRNQLAKITSNNRDKKMRKLKILGGNDPPIQTENLTTDEKIAVQLYAASRKGKKVKLNESEDDTDGYASEDNDELLQTRLASDKSAAEFDDIQDEDDDRRGITYQIFKNQGLAPKRNKDQRNPRVKHRHKFEKAKVRRKGQVRAIRTETKRYSGEISGINMRVKKGVKIQ